jgi:exonuclease SbcD
VRLLHTADWHLGRIFYGASLIEDQAIALDGFCALAADLRPDAIVVAGDVYDRSVPPAEAVTLLDETLTRLVTDVGVPVVVIAGNHDSPDRLAFGNRLLARGGLHVVGPVHAEPVGIAVATSSGPARIWALPHADPSEVACALDDECVRGHEAAMAAVLARVRAATGAAERHVVVAHAFVTGGKPSESERPLSVGGTAQVSSSLFDGFDYVALGHLHRPQSLADSRIRYSGSLLKYSFDEHDHHKSVTLVEIGEGATLEIQEYELPFRRDVRKITGHLRDLLAALPAAGRDDYLWVDLLDELPVSNPLERIRAIYPNVMYAARVAATAPQSRLSGLVARDIVRLGMAELFERFFADSVGEALSQDQHQVFAALVKEFEYGRRSA